MAIWLLPLLVSVGLGAAGQVAFKQGIGAVQGRSPLGLVAEAMATPLVWSGFLAYGASLLIWLWVLSKVPLSLAYPMVALGYIAVVVISAWFLGERVTMVRWVAVAVIAGGVLLLARSSAPA